MLRAWQAEELKAFEQWLRSPWCNSNKNLLPLFEQLKKHHPQFDTDKLNKEKLFRRILPNGKFSDRRMNNLLSEAYLAAEKFIIFQKLNKTPLLQKELLLQELQSRHQDEWFFKEAHKNIDQLENKSIKSWEEELSLYQTHRQVYHHPHQALRLQPGALTIVRMDQQIDLSYLLEKAAIINEMLFRNRILKDEQHQLDQALQLWQTASESLHHPAIQLYKLRFAYMQEGNREQYQILRDEFLDIFEQLNHREQKIHLFYLINDTMQLIKLGKVDITACLPLYQLGLTAGILLNQGKLTRNTFTLIVSASNTKGSFDYTHQFIEEHADKVDESIRTDCIHWAKAHTAYWQKELEVSLDILQNHNFKVPYLQLISRVLHSQVYFDLMLEDPSYQFYLFNYFDAFEKRLNREQLWSKLNKTSFLRFVQKSRTLARYYVGEMTDTEKINQLLEGSINVQALNWLKQKRSDILGRKAK
ncbi:MAG: hypothetical protein AAFV95_17565 [Bacteroidota bacterium]